MSTSIPIWGSGNPSPAELPLPAGLHALATAEGVGPDAVLLAAHAVVVRALTGADSVETTVVRSDGAGRPCAEHLGVDATARTWRELIHAEPRPVTGPTETVVGSSVAEQLSVVADGDVLRLHLPARMGDHDYAERIAGYHVAALAAMVADPGAPVRPAALLSPAERLRAIHGMAGPERPRPDRRVHELVAERAARHPERVALVHGGETLTYGELDARAAAVAGALLARGLRAEDVVGVVTARDLDWAVAVLGVFRAGGAYLPVEPEFPAERIRDVLSRAGARLVLAQRATHAAVDGLGLPLDVVTVADAQAEAHPAGPAVRVTGGQLAYLYFTSGSTGRPKGAMCEHAGMLNHLMAKVEDLAVGEHTVVAQTAPQCFDISLWQLLAALVTGGRTVIVPQADVLDVSRLVDTFEAEGVEVAQLVPSYLEVLLTHLAARPRALPSLRCMSATGEALRPELVRRWFRRFPGVALVNAYGLTETSDDTNHDVLTAPPAYDRVPLGRPVANAVVYVVDDDLEPVPLGAAGEIVFSGVCVGRGYVGDPERTRAAFGLDPHRPGERLYRSGDRGRWRPDGKLEFLGRRDAQVKVRGFRVELGEIEARLLQVPGVRDGAVVVAGTDRLLACYSGAAELDPARLRAALGTWLPAYMVPGEVRRFDRLPLTGNGKIDRAALLAAAERAVTETPDTAAERELARTWAAILDVPIDQVGRRDHFFESGGTSLSAIRLAVQMGRRISLKQIVETPVLADLATRLVP